ncbi:exported hypothetical protein [Candidatus Sulfopaludibacter sp. SbA3]|nr:exported hypothetical protein [Candidatus Sulfopaludibacter sp. SbA3]
MTNNKTILSLFLLAASASGQPGLLGSVGTTSRDGWKFSVSYVAKPPLLPGQHSSVQGNTDVIHTDTSVGGPVIFHRFLTDPASQTYFGYDVVVEPVNLGRPDGNGISTARWKFQPFSLRADQLIKKYHAAEFRPLPAPQLPSETFQSGQTIAIDLLANPATGQRVVDYIQVSYEPTGWVPGNAPPRDFRVSDVLLHLVAPELRLNDSTVTPAIMPAQVIRRKLVWVSIPGHGRFLFSLAPVSDPRNYPFLKAGVVNGMKISFVWNGDRFELTSREPITESSGAWNLYVLAAPAPASPSGFSFGAVDSVEQFLSQAQ